MHLLRRNKESQFRRDAETIWRDAYATQNSRTRAGCLNSAWMIESCAHNFSALTTDLYEVTMACGYFKAGVTDHEAVFHVTFRENPFAGQFTVACGLATAIDFLRTFHFTDKDVDYIGSQHGNDGKPLFDSRFLHYL